MDFSYALFSANWFIWNRLHNHTQKAQGTTNDEKYIIYVASDKMSQQIAWSMHFFCDEQDTGFPSSDQPTSFY